MLLGVLFIAAYLLTESKWFNLGVIIYGFILIAVVNSSLFKKQLGYKINGAIIARKLANNPRNLSVQSNVKFFNPDRITIGNNCDVSEGVVFAPIGSNNGKKYSSRIQVGNNVHFGTEDRIASMNSVIIEDDVLFAAFVHITDHSHEYRNVGIPVVNQSVFSKGPVTIKKGSWLALGCHVLSGVTIGEYSVVAANSVVTKDVPPYSVVAGNPARLVSQFNFETGEWEKVQK